jgi:predicted dehydrogenase
MNSDRTPLSRRAFIQESILASLAAGVLPAMPLRGSETTAPQAAANPGPNGKLQVAVLGVRGRGQDHAAAYASRSDCHVLYLCDADRDVGQAYLERFASRFGYRPKFVQDLREVMADPAVDIVSIATPNHWHALASIWAIQAGKHVYVEKPVSHNISEGRRIVQAARKYQKLCQGGTQRRSEGRYRAAAEAIKAGKIGKVTLIRCVMYRPRSPIGPPGDYPIPPGVDYNLWVGPAPMAKVTRKSFHYDWHWFWDYGNGEIGNNCIHCVDTARILVPFRTLGRWVVSYGGRLGFHDAGETPNTQVAIHDLGDGVTLVQEVRNHKTDKPFLNGAVLIAGEEGYIACDLGANVVLYDRAGNPKEKLPSSGGDHFANFVEAVKAGRQDMLNADVEETHISTALTHLANISYLLGHQAGHDELVAALKPLQVNEDCLATLNAIAAHLKENGIDLQKEPLTLGPRLAIDAEHEKFIDNPDADRLLTREYREPFVVPPPEKL